MHNADIANISEIVFLVEVFDQVLSPREVLVVGGKVVAALAPVAVVGACVLAGQGWVWEAEGPGEGTWD